MQNNTIGKFMVVSPKGFHILYSKKDTPEESIKAVENMLGKKWTALFASGYRCGIIGEPKRGRNRLEYVQEQDLSVEEEKDGYLLVVRYSPEDDWVTVLKRLVDDPAD